MLTFAILFVSIDALAVAVETDLMAEMVSRTYMKVGVLNSCWW